MSLTGGLDWVVGVACSLVSTVLINLGLNVQKLAHNRVIELPKEERKSVYTTKTWLLGIVLFMLGNGGTLVALAFAPASIVTPLGSFSLVCNGIIAPLMLGEKFTTLDGAGTLFIIVGSILSVVSGPKNETEFTLEDLLANYQKTPFLVYIMALLGLISGTYMLSKFGEHKLVKHGGIYSQHPEVLQWRRVLPLAYAGLGGLIGSQTVLTAKSSLELIKSSFILGVPQFGHFFSWIIVGLFVWTIALQFQWINAGLRYFEAIVINPFYYAMWTIFSIIGSNMYFDEFFGITTVSLIMFLLGMLVSMMGVYLLSMHPPSYSEAGDGDTSSIDSASRTSMSTARTLRQRVLLRMAKRKLHKDERMAPIGVSRDPTPIPPDLAI